MRNARHKHRKQRSRLEIITDILCVARNGAKKTEIVYKANLNFTRLKSYLAYLESNGLLELSGTVYTTTARGEEFLREYHQMEENLQT
ncbi:MAG: hypothetical protein EFT35_01470 [Methanophagales archaeon ANME-1-THS]|nr:MAG: hypothetical protein EFT35_01470 [Methanophagales archaeon ANME-1-THS]